ncbi:hypothetical protein C0V70_18695 [Bacteriovorax stolpii]|uniref:Uncharacterized protein n=1 Tax=Bacteriovorax stolpii TaxID=960 RepID=A0A2K9NX70_BACTC|nr:hypothetical protein [Bacteriovorax stolpii]AUO00097.1 hypothetical protein C0V70_18695 [Bacteriovorax stolpii]TDP54010.1 hypothetical protein C8D79_1292 [Bacteriovorax stolpii]
MTMSLNRFLAIASLAVIPATSFALPIDWHGSFGVDSTLLSSFRRIDGKTARTATNNGSQEVALDTGDKSSASWQSYILKLAPTMIINDAATFKAELTTGYASGGFLGDSAQTDKAGDNTVPVYYHNEAKGSSVNIKKAYLELYSDTATYMIGRHTYNWGLGAIYNDGSDAWDRHASSRDGITMKLKIGNFYVNPFWSKVSNNGLTDATNSKELGAGLLYDNPERDIAFGLLYTVKSSSANNTHFSTSIDPTATNKQVGETDVKITDIYLKKVWGKFDVAVEVPLISGDLGKTNADNTVTSYSTKAILVEANYKSSDSWNFGFNGGRVNGQDGSRSKFGALFLNPNYQVANILFRYNLNAIGDSSNASVYDSYITNTMYFKLKSSYSTEKWTFDTAVIYAKALETAEAGKAAYNHTKNKMFNAVTTQSDDLGTEIDVNATYKWNNEISIGAGLGYLVTGDYFSYTNDTTVKNETKNSLLLQINTSVTF